MFVHHRAIRKADFYSPRVLPPRSITDRVMIAFEERSDPNGKVTIAVASRRMAGVGSGCYSQAGSRMSEV